MAVNIRRNGEATFVFDQQQEARRVFLVGDFNDWNPTARRMVRSKDGSFRARLRLDPGEHHFKFVVDDQWLPDFSTEQQANPFGTTNSVIRVA